jgi:hypothetical protein
MSGTRKCSLLVRNEVTKDFERGTFLSYWIFESCCPHVICTILGYYAIAIYGMY